jgi:hypothetical protein
MQICGTCGFTGDGEAFTQHRCAAVVKKLRQDLAERDSWIQAYETRIATMTKMLQEAEIIGTLKTDERDQT